MTGPGDSGERGGPPGVRVVLDARPVQEPDRAPITAAYLDGLLRAFDADPLAGESFALLLRSDLDDPTHEFIHLDVVGRRLLPPTRLLRSAALTLDPFLLRGASLGAAWRADRGGAAGAVYHMAGSGPLPIASDLPVVATVLDLAPWELPEDFGRTPSTRFGQRLRAQLLREAAAVIVGTNAVAGAARRLVHVRADRIHVVGLAPRAAFALPVSTAARADAARSRSRLGLPERYLVYPGRFDARQDLATLLGAIADLARGGRPADLGEDVPWPPRILVLGASPDDRAAIARMAAKESATDLLAYAPAMSPAAEVGLVAEAHAVVLPMRSDAAGLAALDAIAAGTPVIASAVGALPEVVGAAGILVEPGESDRLATAIRAVWTEPAVHDRIEAAAGDASSAPAGRRTWADVAAETRRVYATAGIRPREKDAPEPE
jgi:glycosyltransferase involved in cell wall biosynthesis